MLPMTTPPDPQPDQLTIMEATQRLESEGFVAQFRALEAAAVQCLTCRETRPADQFHMPRIERTEGVSDPDDMIAIVALVCPSCQARGTLTLSYGPEAPVEHDDVLRALDDTRSDS